MILGDLVLLIILLVIIILAVSYLHYKYKLYLVKHKESWFINDIKYVDSIIEVSLGIIGIISIIAILYITIINWNMPL